MQISGLFRGYPDRATLGTRGEPAHGESPQASAPQARWASAATATLRQIVARYDMTDISPREFSEMVQEVHQAGALSEEEYQQLASIRLELDLEGIDPDERLDLLDLFLRKLQRLQRRLEDLQDEAEFASPEERSAVERLQQQLAWIEKFAAIQSAPDARGLDALA